MNQSSKLLVAKDIWKNYGPVAVLKGVSLEIDKGELVSIVGASGAGKSTLLYIVSSLEKADRGEVFFNGQAVTELNNKQLANYRNHSIGFVFQFHHLLPEFTALENVCIPGWIAKSAKKKVNDRAMELLDFMGLADKASKKPNSLSGGEQQRVAVARALLNNPTLIFADEPTGSLDEASGERVIRLLFELNQASKSTLVLVTHDPALASRCQRQLHLQGGRLA